MEGNGQTLPCDQGCLIAADGHDVAGIYRIATMNGAEALRQHGVDLANTQVTLDDLIHTMKLRLPIPALDVKNHVWLDK